MARSPYQQPFLCLEEHSVNGARARSRPAVQLRRRWQAPAARRLGGALGATERRRRNVRNPPTTVRGSMAGAADAGWPRMVEQHRQNEVEMSQRFQSGLAVCVSLSAIFVVLGAPGLTPAETGWPHWRGPTGNGVSPDGRPPVEWGESKNIKWKVEVPGQGTASPIVWGDKVFVATAIAVGASEKGASAERQRGSGRGGEGRGRGAPPIQPQRFTLLCLDRASGRIAWSRTAAETMPHEGHHATHGFASASPCTDGQRVYGWFGSRGLFCYDFQGSLLWKKTDFGHMHTRERYGEGSSPTIHGDAIIVPWDQEGPSYLIALDTSSGNTLWKVDRDEPTSWATPLVVEHGGRKQVVASGQNFARGYDLATGEELWRCPGQTMRPVASPVAGHGLVFIGSGFQGSFLGAFRLDRRGNLEGTEGVAWTIHRDTPDVPSLLLSGKRLYFHAKRSNLVSCVYAITNQPHFSERVDGIEGEVYASPVGANGKIYLTARNGVTVVIEDADRLAILAANHLDEGVDATPAIAGDEIFLRGRQHLYCFKDQTSRNGTSP